MEELKILELFGGIGAIRKAFEKQNIPHKVVDFVEIDKYAVASYNVMFNENFETQDITTWDKDIDVDFIMHGSPCQDFSVAGKQAGGDIGSGTRSSLMYETIRIVGKLRPKYVMWENVKNLLSKKHKHNFDAYIETMNILGYNSYYQVLNAKDYGIPQNRERVYTISIRKDIDKGNFVFPEKEELKLRLKDMLEDRVEEKYYLSDNQVERIQFSDFMQEKTRIQEKEYCDTILSRDYKDPKCIRVGDLAGGKWDKINESCRRVYSEEGISPTIHTCQGGNTEPKVARIGGIFDTESSKHQAGSIYDKEGLSPTLDVMQGGWRQPSIIEDNYIEKKYNNFIEKNGYIPEMFNPYNTAEITNVAPTQSTQCGSTTLSATVLKLEQKLPGAYGRDFGSKGKIQDTNGECDTLQAAMGNGGGNVPIIKVNNGTKKGYDEAIEGDSINISYPNSKTRRGRVGHQVSQTLQCNDLMSVVEYKEILKDDIETLENEIAYRNGTKDSNLRIRKLTPKECWRLMGFDDEDFDKAQKVNSNTQLYKQARKLDLCTSFRKNITKFI